MLNEISCLYVDWSTIGAWVGGIGSAGAAIAAIYIARLGDQAREVERENALEIYKTLVAPEITKFAIALPGIRSYLLREQEGKAVLWANVCDLSIYASLLDGVPEMEKHAEMLRLLPLKDGKVFALITMLCTDLSLKLRQSLQLDRFVEPPAAVVARIDLLTKYLTPLCALQEVEVSAVGQVIGQTS